MFISRSLGYEGVLCQCSYIDKAKLTKIPCHAESVRDGGALVLPVILPGKLCRLSVRTVSIFHDMYLILPC